MKKSNPKISVIITCYNYGRFIDEAIESVKDQTFRDFEIILIDDCSTEQSTQDKIKHLSTLEYIDFKVIALKKNVGVSKARNLAVEQAKGKYIIFLDGDDKIHKDCLQCMYDIITQTKYNMISCLVETFGRENIKEKSQKVNLHLFAWIVRVHVTFLMEKEQFLKIKGFDPFGTFKEGSEEFDLWLRLMESGNKPYIIQDHLFYYRKHFNSRSDVVKAKKDIDYGLRIKLISSAPNVYYNYICELRKEKLNRKLKIGICVSIIINIIQILS